ncbi:MAG: sulfatase family protein [Paraglaciecola chathamensis]
MFSFINNMRLKTPAQTLLTLCVLLLVPNAFAEQRPNIILIVADDLNWDDLGAYGNTGVKTPNLDKLAKNGMRFDSAFLTASSCSPSRASMITGRYPHNTDAEQLHWPLPKEQLTVSQTLRDAGYWTAAAGKWHLGEDTKQRFDEVRESKYGIDEPSGSAQWVPLLEMRPKEKPFFLWLASWDSHRPFYQGEYPHSHSQEDVRLPPYYPATELYMNDFAAYYDEISRLDEHVGKVVSTLERQGVKGNTLIIFVADNGRPFARDKTTLYDSGVKTPFIAHWPDGIAKGSISDSIISSIDLAPTFTALAKADTPTSFEGHSLVSLFKNPSASFRDYAVSERNWHDFEDHGRSVRTKRYRYIRNNYNDLPATPSADTVYHKTWWELTRLFEQGALTEHQARPFLAPRPKEELYDLLNDPFELTNLATDENYLSVLRHHSDILDKWILASGDFIPSFRTPDDFDRVKGAYAPHRKRPRPSKMQMYQASGSY